MKNTAKEITNAARAAKTDVMDRMIAMSETKEERARMEAAKAKLAAMGDSEWLRYHGMRA